VLKNYLILIFCLPGWICSQDKTDPGRVFYQMHYKPGDWITYANTRFVSTIAVGFNKVFIGTGGGILRYDAIKNQFDYPLTTSNGMLDNDVQVVAWEQRTDYIWAATRTGLQYYDPLSRQFRTAPYFELGMNSRQEVLSIGFDMQNIWIHTPDKFYITTYSLFGCQPSEPPKGEVVWFGALALRKTALPNIFTSNESGYTYYPAEKVFADRDFRKYPVRYYVTDAMSNLWIGTAGAGLWRASSISGLARPLMYGPAMSSVTGMAFDGDKLWLGGSLESLSWDDQALRTYSAVTVWDQAEDRFDYYESGMRNGFRAERVTVIFSDDQNIWIGTEEGLIRNIKNTTYWATYGVFSGLYHSHILSLAAHNKRLFAGTAQGLNYLMPIDKKYAVQKVEIPALFNCAIYKIIVYDDVIWLGTSNGIYAIDEKNKTWFHYNGQGFKVGPDTYLREEIRGMAENDSLIFFAHAKGICHYHKTRAVWESIPVNTDFLSAGINDAKADAYNLWIATNDGVLRWILAKRKWIYYSFKDGLADPQVYCMLTDGDYIWFGTRKGVTQFFWNSTDRTE